MLRNNSKVKDLETFGQFLRRLHCLLCCSGYGGHDLPTRAWSFLNKQQFVHLDRYEQWHIRDDSLLRSEPPHYVRRMLDDVEENVFIEVHDQNLKRVTVYKETE